MLPGFIPRLHTELLRAIASPPTPSRQPIRPDRPVPPSYDRYAPLRPLVPYFAIVNNPSPLPPQSNRAAANSGKAPAFSPATMAWVGGSLAGYVDFSAFPFELSIDSRHYHRSLKTGGVEVARERWDEADPSRGADESMDTPVDLESRAARNILPDWTRTPLPAGAPPAAVKAPLVNEPVGA